MRAELVAAIQKHSNLLKDEDKRDIMKTKLMSCPGLAVDLALSGAGLNL